MEAGLTPGQLTPACTFLTPALSFSKHQPWGRSPAPPASTSPREELREEAWRVGVGTAAQLSDTLPWRLSNLSCRKAHEEHAFSRQTRVQIPALPCIRYVNLTEIGPL